MTDRPDPPADDSEPLAEDPAARHEDAARAQNGPTGSATPEAEDADVARARQSVAGFKRLALIVLGGLGVLVLVVVGTMTALYVAATADVPEYEAALPIDLEAADANRRELESQLAALASDTQTRPEWSSRLTAEQINAWLATRLARDFPGFHQAGLEEPRVVLGPGYTTLAARSTAARIEGVVSVTLRPRVTERGELVLEVLAAKIGRLALPLDALIAQLRETPLERVAPMRWARGEKSSAVVLDLDRLDTGGPPFRVTGIDIRNGEILVRGESDAPE